MSVAWLSDKDRQLRPQAWASLTGVGAEKVAGHLGELWEIRGSLEAIERGMPV